jgi:hypothetical protein
MWQDALLGFFAGVFGANSVPHFVRGITRESYPCVLGNSSIPNLLGGWGSFVIAATLIYVYATGAPQNPTVALICGGIGALLMGLFHAAGLAIGEKS